jgi:hypothetical protein
LRAEQINMATGESEAILLKAKATAAGIDAVANSIAQGKESAQGAVSLSVAEKYVDAFGKLAKEGTSVVVPGNVGDIGSMIATAMGVYGKVSESQARAMAPKQVSAPSESSSDKPQSVTDSVLESFEDTRAKH